jgi:hypothetical protein
LIEVSPITPFKVNLGLYEARNEVLHEEVKVSIRWGREEKDSIQDTKNMQSISYEACIVIKLKDIYNPSTIIPTIAFLYS